MTTDEILMQILEEQKKLVAGQKQINKRLDNIEQEAKITTFAINHIGDKFEELVTLLNDTNVVEFKY